MEHNLIIDCFAGGGGASVGIEMALGRPVDIAINHDPDAILMHKTNHPGTLHLTEDIFKVDLQKYVGNQHVALMWASPDCTSHSKAKGGQPRKQGLRILPWAVYKHAKAILPDVIIMENVEEIQQWGPLDEKGHPIKERAGEDYQKFISAMENIGYEFDSRELVAADYGAPCTDKLKKRVRMKWEHEHPDHHTYVWGYDLNEKNRADRVCEALSDYDHEFPLIEHGLTKEEAHGIANRLGLKRPIMYDLGYPNNNCVGCPKGGMGYWNKIRVDFPEVFERRARQEREISHSCINGVFLDELEPDRGNINTEIMEDCTIACQLLTWGK